MIKRNLTVQALQAILATETPPHAPVVIKDSHSREHALLGATYFPDLGYFEINFAAEDAEPDDQMMPDEWAKVARPHRDHSNYTPQQALDHYLESRRAIAESRRLAAERHRIGAVLRKAMIAIAIPVPTDIELDNLAGHVLHQITVPRVTIDQDVLRAGLSDQGMMAILSRIDFPRLAAFITEQVNS